MPPVTTPTFGTRSARATENCTSSWRPCPARTRRWSRAGSREGCSSTWPRPWTSGAVASPGRAACSRGRSAPTRSRLPPARARDDLFSCPRKRVTDHNIVIGGSMTTRRHTTLWMFAIGLGVFTLGSVAAALAPSVEALNVARAVQGLGGAIVMPLTLTLLSAAVPPAKRGLALGAWGGVGGLAIAFGPLVGGAVVEGISWHWIFWLNVPIGLVLVPLALRRLEESYGPAGRLDLPGVALASAGLFGIVWGLVRGNEQGWASAEIVGSLAVGAILVAAFVAWELRARAPMLPMRFFRSRGFALANAASFLMYFGMFGSIFLLAQFFVTIQGYSPLQSGLRILPWTLAPMFIAPVAGALSDRISPRLILGTGLALQAVALAWIGLVSTPTVPYSELIIPFILAGVGMGLFFAL